MCPTFDQDFVISHLQQRGRATQGRAIDAPARWLLYVFGILGWQARLGHHVLPLLQFAQKLLDWCQSPLIMMVLAVWAVYKALPAATTTCASMAIFCTVAIVSCLQAMFCFVCLYRRCPCRLSMPLIDLALPQ